MPKDRRNRRSPTREFDLYDDDMSRGWRSVKRISLHDGRKLELAGRAYRLYDEITGEFKGWQREPEQKRDARHDALGRPTPELMNVSEMDKVAGLHGRSQTLGLPLNSELRLIRVTVTGHVLPPEDAIEKAIVKHRILGAERLPLPVHCMQRDALRAAAD